MKNKKEIHKNLFAKDNSRAISYINLFKEQDYNFYISRTDSYRTEFRFNQFNDILISALKSNDTGSMYINGVYQVISVDKSLELYNELNRIDKNNIKLIEILNNKINSRRECTYRYIEDTVIEEIIERIDEFDVVLNNKLDEINLERLLDFYEIDYRNGHYKLGMFLDLLNKS